MLTEMEHMKLTLDERNSMLHWWPLVEDLDLPKPETIIVEVEHDLAMGLLEGGTEFWERYKCKIMGSATSIGYPLFMRTDYCSGKHSYKNTCYVNRPEKLLRNLAFLIEENELAGMMGLPYGAIVLRKMIGLEHRFVAFSGRLPIGAERRYFIRDGQVECHHPYWVQAAVAEGMPVTPITYTPVVGWHRHLAALNAESDEEVALLSEYAELLGERLEGYWSLDFARDWDGAWWFIDAALGDVSFHWEGCEFNLETGDTEAP